MNNNQKIVIYGTDTCVDCIRAKGLLKHLEIAYVYKNIEERAVEQEMFDLNGGSKTIPTIIISEKILKMPSNAELIDALGIKRESLPVVHDLVCVGAGPTALTAAIYTTREDIETVLFEKGAIGGLAATTDWIDNYPGFSDGVSGLDLADNMRKQAERFGAEIELGEVSNIVDEGEYKRMSTTSGDYLARAVLIATGSDYKKLSIKGEDTFYGRGVHYCATCDGAFYRDKHLVVIGSGNSAVQESLFLTRFASKIDLLVRGDHLKASDVLNDELAKNDKITIHFNVESTEIVGEDGKVVKIVAKDKSNGELKEFAADGIFVFVGLNPNTGFLKGSSIELDQIGFIKTNSRLETNMSGVFAAGDVRSGATMQIASATGEGATAALRIREYLEQSAKEAINMKNGA